jgi:thioredoxin-related protein
MAKAECIILLSAWLLVCATIRTESSEFDVSQAEKAASSKHNKRLMFLSMLFGVH